MSLRLHERVVHFFGNFNIFDTTVFLDNLTMISL